ncbi:MAG: hypothetical protein QOE13_3451 [Gaiellaceae bacterium]|jgi:hypothetical protein|nr:hypothetical protein [Gaiellaceae bacterium]
MATLIKKGRKSPAAKSAPEPAEETTSMEVVAVADPEAQDDAPAQAGIAYSPPTPPGANMPRSYGTTSGYDVGATYAPPGGADDFQLPVRHYPSEPPPSPEPPAGPAGLLQRVLLFSGETTAQERDRIAAQEFEQAIAPVMEYMRVNNPDASTPEEAARIWAENQGEITPDPRGGSYVPGDSFDRDARVYYRLLNRDYEKTPRPSEKRKESRALSRSGGADGYRLLPGTRGW